MLWCWGVLLLVPAVVSATEPATGGWTLDKVLDRLEQANGGEEAIQAIRNVRIQGRVESGEQELEFTMLKKRPNRLRLILRMEEGLVTTYYDGEEGWRTLERNGQVRTVQLEEEETADFLMETDFDGPLLGEAMPGMERTFLGVERIDRVDYLVVETRWRDTQTRHYIDSRNFRELKMERYELSDGEARLVTTAYYKDYKKFGPLWLAQRIERVPEGAALEVVLVEQVDLNTALLDRAFRAPQSAD